MCSVRRARIADELQKSLARLRRGSEDGRKEGSLNFFTPSLCNDNIYGGDGGEERYITKFGVGEGSTERDG